MKIAEQFAVMDDEGNRYTVVKYDHHATHRPLDRSQKALRSGWHYELTDGRHVNEEDGEFFIVEMDREDDTQVWRVDEWS